MNSFTPILAIMACHILTGTASVTTRYLVNVLEPVEIACLRYLLGGLAILPLYFIFRSRVLNKILWLKIIGLGILFFAIFPFLFSWSYMYTSATRGSLVLATMPIWTMLISKAVGHEKIKGLSLLATVLTLIGLAIALSDKLLINSEQSTLFKGEFIMLLAALAGAVYVILSHKVLQKVPASTMTPIAMLAGSVFLFPYTITHDVVNHLLALSTLQKWLMLYLGIVAGGIAFFLFNWALHKSTATFTTMFITLHPITAIFLGNLLLGEVISTNFIVGVLIVFSGLGLAVRSQILESTLTYN